MDWKQFVYAGNPLVPRWDHCATLHNNTRILIYGGRADHGYYDRIDVIDVCMYLIKNSRINNSASQLIEMKPEEAAKEKSIENRKKKQC